MTAVDDDSSSKFPKDKWTLLFQGAESRVYKGEYYSKPAILKERFKKTYRLPELDQKLTKERIRAELKAYEKIGKRCKELFQRMSTVLYSDDRNIVMSEITDAQNVSEFINKNEPSSAAVADALFQMGVVVAQIHSCGIVHGDLTTSNFLVKQLEDDTTGEPEGKQKSLTDEDRAVDLYVLERAIESTHPQVDFALFLQSYQEKMGTDKINKKLDQVRMRGRKRLAIG
ncbi:TP53 regulating kinase [Tyrophagus putrescentiae]|nr:TP53 regulating kinase [Tyrophagus putrescentiae]